MTVVQALPSRGDVFFDVRDDGRALRVGWHATEGVVVLSSWRYGSCVSSCQVDRDDVPALIAELARGLAATPPRQAWTDPIYVDFSRDADAPRSPLRSAWTALRRAVTRVVG
jgi:hypothetical protein